MPRSILCGLLLLLLVVCASALKIKRQPNGADAAADVESLASNGSVDPLANPNFNPVVNSSLGLYFIYYGNEFGAGGQDEQTPAGVQQYCTDLSGSAYLNILTQYYGTTKTDYATRDIHFVGQSLVGAPYGLTISDVDQRCGLKILERLLLDPTMNIPFDATVQYYMIWGSDVIISNADTGCGDQGACGLHDQREITINGVKSKYLCGWVDTTPGCIGTQVAQLTGPNANANVQSVLDTLSHEICETITDPDQDPQTNRAWQDSQGYEVGDKCETDYGTVHPSSKIPNAYYNVLANGNEYMIQSEWSNAILGCSTGVPVPPPTPSPTGAAASASSSPAAGASASQSPLAPSTSQTTLPATTPSNSGAPAPSASNFPTGTPSPSVFASGPLPGSNCISCPHTTCKREKKFEKICKNKLGGTFSNATAGSLCCNNPTTFTTYSWSVFADTCFYPVPEHKLALLCDALGGRQTCQVAASGGVRITCSR